MPRQVLASSKSQKVTHLSDLGKFLKSRGKDNGVRVATASTTNADVALIDGDALKANDAEEQSILTTARNSGLPIVLENANRNAMLQVTGLGVKADVAVIRQGSDGVHITSFVPMKVKSLKKETAKGISTHPETKTAKAKKAGKLTKVGGVDVPSDIAPDSSSKANQILAVLDEPVEAPDSAVRVASFSAPTDADSTVESKKVYFLGMRSFSWDIKWDDGGLQRPFIGVDFKIELYAVNNPNNKFLVISPMGSGLRPGALRYNDRLSKGFFMEYASVEYGPASLPAGMSVVSSSPDNNNNSGTYTITKGFEIGGSLSKDGPGLSGSYNSSETRQIDLKDYRVENKMNGTSGRWEYHLASVESRPYNSWKDLKVEGLKYRLASLPAIGVNGFQPENHVVWKVPSDFNDKVKFNFTALQRVRLNWLILSENILGWTVSYEQKTESKNFWVYWNDVEIDFSQVQAPVIDGAPTGDELSKKVDALEERLGVLEYRVSMLENQLNPPKTGVVRSTGPTVKKHKVKKGETLSHIALKYYGSATRKMWMPIYEANKSVIGNKPSRLREGVVLEIPDLNNDDRPRA